MSHIQEELEKIGLNGSETKVYLFLLSNGVSSPSQIAKGTGIARTNTYHILNSLREMKLVERQERGRRYVYIAGDPSSTLRVLERRKVAMEGILPELDALYKNQKNKPVIQFFDGWESVKEIYTRSLEAEEIHWIGSTESLSGQEPSFFKKYQKDVKRRGIIGNDILPSGARGKTGKDIKEILGAIYSQRYMPATCDDVETDMIIWGDNIGLVSLDEPVFGTLITDKALANTFRVIFGLAWTSSEK